LSPGGWFVLLKDSLWVEDSFSSDISLLWANELRDANCKGSLSKLYLDWVPSFSPEPASLWAVSWSSILITFCKLTYLFVKFSTSLLNCGLKTMTLIWKSVC
jgi:hypothetical protein